MASSLHEEANVPTKEAKSLETVLTALSQSDQANLDAPSLSTATAVCGRVEWINSEATLSDIAPIPDHTYHLQQKQVQELENPDNRLITQFRGGLFLYLRLVVEISAAATSYLDTIHPRHLDQQMKLLEKIDDLALAETLSHYRDLSVDDLWFFTQRTAADARSRKRIFPGRYLTRWRRFVTDIIRTRNSEARVQMTLREKPVPQELKIMIFQHLVDLEELPPESSWEVLWSTREKPKFHSDTSSYLDLEGIEGVSQKQLRGGGVVFDPISRQFAWALKTFGHAIYFGYEPTLLYDPYRDCWTWNQKHLDKFGTYLTSSDRTR